MSLYVESYSPFESELCEARASFATSESLNRARYSVADISLNCCSEIESVVSTVVVGTLRLYSSTSRVEPTDIGVYESAELNSPTLSQGTYAAPS